MIYILFFLLLLIGYLSKKNSNNTILKLLCFCIWLIIGLRNFDCFPDTMGYVSDFDYFKKMSLDKIWDFSKTKTEPLYVILSWLPSIISDNYQVFLLFWSLFPSIGLYFFCKQNLETPKDYAVAFLIVFVLGYFAFVASGIRQAAALSLVMISYRYLMKITTSRDFLIANNFAFIKFLALITIAFTIHNSTLVFLAVFFIRLLPFYSWYILIAIGAVSIGNLFHLEQFTIVSAMLLGDRFDHYGTSIVSELSLSGYFVQLFLFLLCYVKRADLIYNSKENVFFLNMMLVGLIFQAMTGVIGEMFRIAFYFNMFAMILVPRALAEYRKSRLGRFIVYLFILSCFIYLFFLSSSNLPAYGSSISLL